MSPSFMTYLFGSASAQLASRIEATRVAESKLVSLARRFGNTTNNDNDVPNLELIDTKIQRSVLGISENDNDDEHKCQMKSMMTRKKEDDDEDEENMYYTIHGVKVTAEEEKQSKPQQQQQQPPLVLLHGYANGALYYYRNLIGLARSMAFGGTVYSLDMLGWGLSSRPHFPSPPNKKKNKEEEEDEEDDPDNIRSAEDFFVESLEAWRSQNNISKMTLGGHSLGGYLSVAYAERYPQRVHRLILLSPVGVPFPPHDTPTTLQNDDDDADDDDDDSTLKNKRIDPRNINSLPMSYRLLFKFVRKLWSQNITPGSFFRSITQKRGKSLVSTYITRRLPVISDEEERQSLVDYLYHTMILPGSGEYCLNRLLKPGAYARNPLVDRIPRLMSEKENGGGLGGVTFLYGDRDWMDCEGGLEVQRKWEEMKKEGEKGKVVVYSIKDAGHLLMLDNWEEVNAALIASVLGEKGVIPNTLPRVLSTNDRQQVNMIETLDQFRGKNQPN